MHGHEGVDVRTATSAMAPNDIETNQNGLPTALRWHRPHYPCLPGVDRFPILGTPRQAKIFWHRHGKTVETRKGQVIGVNRGKTGNFNACFPVTLLLPAACHLVQAMADFFFLAASKFLFFSKSRLPLPTNLIPSLRSQVRLLPSTRRTRVPVRMVGILVLMWAKLVGEPPPLPTVVPRFPPFPPVFPRFPPFPLGFGKAGFLGKDPIDTLSSLTQWVHILATLHSRPKSWPSHTTMVRRSCRA